MERKNNTIVVGYLLYMYRIYAKYKVCTSILNPMERNGFFFYDYFKIQRNIVPLYDLKFFLAL